MRITTFVLAAALSGGMAWAEDSAPKAAPAKDAPAAKAEGTDKPATPADPSTATKPATEAQIKELIKQLGDDNPKVRQDASEKLRKIGKSAVPALNEARKSDDLEVSSRAGAIISQIDEDGKPKPPADLNGGFGANGMIQGPNGVRIFRVGPNGGQVQIHMNAIAVGGNGNMSISRTDNNGVKDVTAKENGRVVKIHEEKDGSIKLTVTEPNKEGKDETKEYKAKDVDALKKDDPEAHKLYEKYMGNGNGNGNIQIQIQGMNINGLNVGPGGAVGGAVGGGIGVGGAAGIIEVGDAEAQKMMEQQQKLIEQRMRAHRLDAEKMIEGAKKQADEARKQAEEALKQAEEEAARARKEAEKN